MKTRPWKQKLDFVITCVRSEAFSPSQRKKKYSTKKKAKIPRVCLFFEILKITDLRQKNRELKTNINIYHPLFRVPKCLRSSLISRAYFCINFWTLFIPPYSIDNTRKLATPGSFPTFFKRLDEKFRLTV